MAWAATLGVALLLGWATTGNAQDKIQVTLSAERDHCVVREPVKFRVLFENVSADTLHIPETRYLADMNMKYTFLSISGAHGQEERRYRWIYEDSFGGQGYCGELLAPGDTVQFFLYPNVTYQSDGLRIRGELRRTFDQAGEYRVQVCYSVPGFYYVLYVPESRRIYSNTITMIFREPDASDDEILDAIYKDHAGNQCLDEFRGFIVGSNIQALERVLAAYPRHPLEPYVLFTLGRSYDAVGEKARDPEKALQMFERLLGEYPAFRYEEVRYRQAICYIAKNDKSRAIAVLEQLLRERPLLRDNHTVMVQLLGTEWNAQTAMDWRQRRLDMALEYWNRKESR